jgi:hypothetical protein
MTKAQFWCATVFLGATQKEHENEEIYLGSNHPFIGGNICIFGNNFLDKPPRSSPNCKVPHCLELRVQLQRSNILANISRVLPVKRRSPINIQSDTANGEETN